MTEPVSETTKEERAAWLSSDGDHLNARATRRLLRDYARLEQERDRLRGALEKAQVGLMCCAPLPGYDMKTLHIVRAALAPAQEPESR